MGKKDELIQDRLIPYLFTTVKNACLDYQKEALSEYLSLILLLSTIGLDL